MKMSMNDINPLEKKNFPSSPDQRYLQSIKDNIRNKPACSTSIKTMIDENFLLQQLENNSLNFTKTELPFFASNGLVVVVDDNAFNLLVAEKLMKDFNYSTRTVLGGHEAIDMIKSLCAEGETIKAVLMDCQMPVMDGYETTKILRQLMENNKIPKIPIIAWTANSTEEDIQRCYDCGMSDYLSKPTSREKIRKAFSKL